MDFRLSDRLAHAWNAFRSNDNDRMFQDIGPSYSHRPDHILSSRGNERSIVTAVYNRIAVDAASIDIKVARLDDQGRFMEILNTGLNECLTVQANIDQTGRSFIQDAIMTLLEEGSVALVPVDTSIDPMRSGSFSINTIRTGRVIEWYPRHVKVNVYNDQTGQREDVVLPKTFVAIVENPFYSVMNSPSSTLQRLIRKLNILDVVDEQSGSGKLDLIIQLPYMIKSEMRRAQAEQRRRDIEQQLTSSKYGIAYTDGSEHITQLNRPVENNLMHQIEYLTNLLYSQLGISQAVMDGTADEKTMLNYHSRTIEPIVSALVDAMERTFLTKTARSQHQAIVFFRDPFRLVPVSTLAEIADKFTRNEILTSNEVRQIIGRKPSADPRADELRNKNLNASSDQLPPNPKADPEAINNDLVDE